MVFAFDAPNAIVNTIAAAFFGSLVAAAIVAFLTQWWIEKRERRDRRDELRLQLYLDVVDLVLDNQLELATRGIEGKIPPTELQAKQFGIHHRLRLLGPQHVLTTYDEYVLLVFKSTAHPIQDRPSDPEAVTHARERLIDAMAGVVQGDCSRSKL
jgi:hypothetical protein